MINGNARSDKNDPLYRSTDNWKTELQWNKLGYVFDDRKCCAVNARGASVILVGYRSPFGHGGCVRIHRSSVRKVK